MKKTKKVEKNLTTQIFAVILFLVGICLLFVIPIGTIIGVLLMIASLGMGYKKYKVWLCPSCGYYFKI